MISINGHFLWSSVESTSYSQAPNIWNTDPSNPNLTSQCRAQCFLVENLISSKEFSTFRQKIFCQNENNPNLRKKYAPVSCFGNFPWRLRYAGNKRESSLGFSSLVLLFFLFNLMKTLKIFRILSAKSDREKKFSFVIGQFGITWFRLQTSNFSSISNIVRYFINVLNVLKYRGRIFNTFA